MILSLYPPRTLIKTFTARRVSRLWAALKAYLQHWESGERMEISSWECRPNLGGGAGFHGGQAPASVSSLPCASALS